MMITRQAQAKVAAMIHLPRPLLAAVALLGSTTASVFCVAAQSTTRLSISSAGAQGDLTSGPRLSLSADGRYTAFTSYATTLVSGDTNNHSDAFVHDRVTGTTERVSVSTAGAEADEDCGTVSISGDGRYVAFESASTTLAPDGGHLADVFIHDRILATTEKVSVPLSGLEANGWSESPALSSDGRFVAFLSNATDLVPEAVSQYAHVYVRDRQLGITELVSVSSSGVPAIYYSQSPSISADGRFVAFVGPGDLVPGPGVFYETLYALVRDRLLGTTTLVSKNSAGEPADNGTSKCGISADGRFVAFASIAQNLGGGLPLYQDIFLRDTLTGSTSTVNTDSSGLPAEGNCSFNSISTDGSVVLFSTSAANLVPGDTNQTYDVFARDVLANTTTRISVSDTGSEADKGSNGEARVSEDGTVVVFVSDATNLVANDTNSKQDVFARTVTSVDPWGSLGGSLAGQVGAPLLVANGMLLPGTTIELHLSNGKAFSLAPLVVGSTLLDAAFKGGLMVPSVDLLFPAFTDYFGTVTFSGIWPTGIPPASVVYCQWWIQDPAGPKGYAASNALAGTTP